MRFRKGLFGRRIFDLTRQNIAYQLTAFDQVSRAFEALVSHDRRMPRRGAMFKGRLAWPDFKLYHYQSGSFATADIRPIYRERRIRAGGAIGVFPERLAADADCAGRFDLGRAHAFP